jgi:glucose/arabinose dehydrogenase
MNKHLNLKSLLGISLFSMLGLAVCAPFSDPGDPRLDMIQLPDGFRIEIFAEGVTNARAMCRGDKGTIFVGSRGEGSVYAIIDKDKDNKADEVITLLKDLNMPSGVTFRNGSLYIGEVNRVIRLDAIEDHLYSVPDPVVVTSDLPSDRHHGWKFIDFGPDGKLYVPVGAPCNICYRANPKYASLLRMDPDGGNMEVFASGIRNTVGFAWHPITEELWFTDNGRDWLGDDSPPDELNRAPRKGMHFGYPWCHGGTIVDPKLGQDTTCDAFTPPALNLGPHVAALGLEFYRGKMFPAKYRKMALIAEHGSWNRSDPLGYRIMMTTIEKDKAVGYELFAEGWLLDGEAWGRPVDILEMPDGSILVSDDTGDMIYRISYER